MRSEQNWQKNMAQSSFMTDQVYKKQETVEYEYFYQNNLNHQNNTVYYQQDDLRPNMLPDFD